MPAHEARQTTDEEQRGGLLRETAPIEASTVVGRVRLRREPGEHLAGKVGRCGHPGNRTQLIADAAIITRDLPTQRTAGDVRSRSLLLLDANFVVEKGAQDIVRLSTLHWVRPWRPAVPSDREAPRGPVTALTSPCQPVLRSPRRSHYRLNPPIRVERSLRDNRRKAPLGQTAAVASLRPPPACFRRRVPPTPLHSGPPCPCA